MDKTKVKCENKKCETIIPRIKYQEHMKDCKFLEIKCKCGDNVERINYEEHIKNKCSQREIQCNKCSAIFVFSDHSIHSQHCLYSDVICPLCGIKCYNHEFDKHFIFCEKRKIKCKKCNDIFYVRDIDNHYSLCFKSIKCDKCNVSVKPSSYDLHILSHFKFKLNI